MSIMSERLKQLREERGLSIRQIAAEWEISKSAVSMYERGERKPPIPTLEMISDYYNVDIDYIIGKSDVRNMEAAKLGYNSLAEAYFAKRRAEDGDIAEYMEKLRTNPGMRILFDAAKDASQEDLEKAARIIEALKGGK